MILRQIIKPSVGGDRLPRLSHLRVDRGYQGRGEEWAQRALSFGAEVVRRSRKPPPEEVLRAWAREWFRERRTVNPEQLPWRRGFELLPRPWVAERTFAWIGHNRRMSEDYERLCSTGEALIYASTDLLRALANHERARRPKAAGIFREMVRWIDAHG